MATYRRVAQKVATVYETAVAYDGAVPTSSRSVKDFLDLLPHIYETDPEQSPALILSSTVTTVSVRIEGVLFEVVTADRSLAPFTCDLRNFTIGSLVTRLQQAGHQAQSYPGWADMAATVLIDGYYEPSQLQYLQAFNSVLWRVVRPLALAFDQWSDDIAISRKQLDLRFASGVWLDWWGVLYGIVRYNDESDDRYRRRIAVETMAPRTNGIALEALIKESFGYDAAISDSFSEAQTWYATTVGFRQFATSPGGQVVSFTVYPNLAGSQPPTTNTAGIAAPTAAPVVTVETDLTTGLSAGVYTVCYTYANAAGETLPSPKTVATLTANGRYFKINKVAPLTLPGGATEIRLYIEVPQVTWESLATASYASTTYLWTTTDPTVLAWGVENPTALDQTSNHTNLVWALVPPLVEPTNPPMSWPGLAGYFNVQITQPIEDSIVTVTQLQDFITRHKAAAYKFTLSVRNYYTEEYSTLIEIREEMYYECIDEEMEDWAGRFFITGTMGSLTYGVPESLSLQDPMNPAARMLGAKITKIDLPAAATTPPPGWEYSIEEQYRIGADGPLVPQDYGVVLTILPDPEKRVARLLGGKQTLQMSTRPGLLPAQ